jgi:hypothetical protein
LVMKVIGAASDGSGSQVSIKTTCFRAGKKATEKMCISRARGRCRADFAA